MTTNETDLAPNGEETAEALPEAAEDTASPSEPTTSTEELQAEDADAPEAAPEHKTPDQETGTAVGDGEAGLEPETDATAEISAPTETVAEDEIGMETAAGPTTDASGEPAPSVDDTAEDAATKIPRGERPAITAPKAIGDIPDDLSADDFAKAIEQTVFEFKEGDIVAGTVVRIDQDEVLVDIGYKSEGVIPLRELSIRNAAKPGEIVSVGEDIEALVLQKEDDAGRLVLSKKRAQYERAWGRIERIM
ncbi:MAG: S1 RNA-binding domain-containing protein, partial [Acidimicrobiia bacterium]